MARTKSDLKGISVADLERELEKREGRGEALLQKREDAIDHFCEVLGGIDEQLEDLGLETEAVIIEGWAGKGQGRGKKGGGRRKAGMTLVDALQKVMSTTEPMNPSDDIEPAVRKIYDTKAKDLVPNILQAFNNNPKLFKRVERGLYVMKVVASSKKGSSKKVKSKKETKEEEKQSVAAST
jgi:hypothetical protein